MSLQHWTPATTYVAGAYVSPTADPNQNWVTLAGLTSGAAEPTWPVPPTFNVADGTGSWQLATSFQEQLVAGIVATLQSYSSANNAALRQIWSARPGAFAEFPTVYVGSRDATWTYANQIRQWHSIPKVVLVDQGPDGPEQLARIDALVDGIIDTFSRAYHAASPTSIVLVASVAEIDLSEMGTHLLGYELGLTGDIAEGRV